MADHALHRTSVRLLRWASHFGRDEKGPIISRGHRVASLVVAFVCAGLVSACSFRSDLSSASPYSAYAGKTVALVSPMPVEYDFKARKPSKVVRAGTPVTIRRVFLEKTYIPAEGVSTQIFAVVEYPDPVTKARLTWNYPLGLKPTPYGCAEKIIAAPWEQASTPPVRYVGRDGKSFQ